MVALRTPLPLHHLPYRSSSLISSEAHNPFLHYLLPKDVKKPVKQARLGVSLDMAAEMYSGVTVLDEFNVRNRRVSSLEFIGSYYHTDNLPALGLPEVCLIGRSNVGKSSFINTLMSFIKNKSKKSDMAYVSKTPGYTKSINIFKAVDHKDCGILSIVDLPGYGFAKIKDPATRNNMQSILRAYIRRRCELKLVIFLIDGSIRPQDSDYEVAMALREMELPHLIVCSKMDKVALNKIPAQMLLFRQALNITSPLPIPYSKYGGADLANIWKGIFDACSDAFELNKLNFIDGFETVEDVDYGTFVEGQNRISLKDLRKLVYKNYHLLPESMKGVDIDGMDRDQLLDLLNTAVQRSQDVQNKPPDLIELKQKWKSLSDKNKDNE